MMDAVVRYLDVYVCSDGVLARLATIPSGRAVRRLTMFTKDAAQRRCSDPKPGVQLATLCMCNEVNDICRFNCAL